MEKQYLIAALGLGFVMYFSDVNAPENLGEYGILELLQIFVLAASTGLWLLRGPAVASLNVLIASALLVFVGREASWMRVYGAPEGVVEMLKQLHLAGLLLTLIALTVTWLRLRAPHAQFFRTALRSQYTSWMLLGLVLLLVGDVFEKQVFDIESNLFWEEWSELVAYVCFLVPPVFLSRRQRVE